MKLPWFMRPEEENHGVRVHRELQEVRLERAVLNEGLRQIGIDIVFSDDDSIAAHTKKTFLLFEKIFDRLDNANIPR